MGATKCQFGAPEETKKDNEPTIEDDAMMEEEDDNDGVKDDTMMEEEEEEDDVVKDDASAGIYTNYDPALVSQASDGSVVLFFHADWCPACRSADSNIQKNAGNIPDGISILKVDYDNSKDLKEKHGVTYQHTFVTVDANGNQLNKWNGSPTLDDILKNI